MGLRFELIIAEAEGLPRPEKRASAEEPNPHPVVRIPGIVSVRNFLLVDPGVRVVLVRLKDMRQDAGLFEAAERQRIRRLDFSVFARIGDRPRVEHHAGDAFFGENLGGHSAGMTGTDDQYIHYFFRHWLLSRVRLGNDVMERGYECCLFETGRRAGAKLSR